MQKIIPYAVFTCFFLLSCSRQGDLSDAQIVEKIWQSYVENPDNTRTGFSWLEVNGQLLKKGTVPASTKDSLATKRLPAYMACYDFVSVMGALGEEPGNVCIYYIDNPRLNTHSIMSRGKGYTGQIESKMRADGFTEN